MKKTITFILMLAGIACISCQKPEPKTDVNETKGTLMSLSVSMDEVAKSSYTAQGNALKATWDASEEITVVTYKDYYIQTIDTFTYSGEAGKTSVVFSGNFTGQSVLDAGGEMYIIYPALSGVYGDVNRSGSYNAGFNSGYFECSNDQSRQRISYLDAYNFQIASGAGATNYIKYTDFMTGLATFVGGNPSATLTKHMALFKIVISSDSESYLGNLTINEDQYCIPFTAEFSLSSGWKSLNCYQTQKIYVDSNWNYKEDGVFTYYLPIIPGKEIPAGTVFSFNVSGANTYNINKTISSAFTPVTGNVYKISLTL